MNFLSKLNIDKIKQNQNYIIFTIILLSWSHQWLSIGSFINTAYKDFSLSSILAYRNQSLIIFVINLFITLNFNKKKNIRNNIYFYYLLLPIAYLLGIVNLFIDNPNEKNVDFFYYLTFILQMINTLVILNNFSKINNIDETILLKINLLIIFIYIVIFFILKNFNLYSDYHLNFLKIEIVTNKNGISRMLGMLSIFIACYYFIKKNQMFLIILFILNFFIIHMQSRQGLALIIIQLSLIIFLTHQGKGLIKQMFKYFLIVVIIPMSLSFSYSSINKLQKNTTMNKLQENTSINKLQENTFENKLEKFGNHLLENRLFMLQGELWNYRSETGKWITQDNYNVEKKLDNFSTGRYAKWRNSLMYILNSKIKNILFGNGPQIDRIILNGGDVSNGILYVFLCGGLFGLIFFLMIIKKNFKIISFAFYNKKKQNVDLFFCFSVCCIISLTLRSLIENGFLVYGVDFLLITSSTFYLIKKLKFI